MFQELRVEEHVRRRQESERTSPRHFTAPSLFDPRPDLVLAEKQHAARNTQRILVLHFKFGTVGLAVLGIVDPALCPLAVAGFGETRHQLKPEKRPGLQRHVLVLFVKFLCAIRIAWLSEPDELATELLATSPNLDMRIAGRGQPYPLGVGAADASKENRRHKPG